jgi:hypothetical protein
MKLTHLLLATMLLCGVAQAQTVTLTVTPTSGNGSVTPSATWSTSPAGATGCVASGGWTGNKAASGTQALSAITSTTQYSLSCTWPGAAGSAHITWTPPTTNSDNSPLTNLAGYRILIGTSATNFTLQATVSDPAASSGNVGGLTPNTNYFFTVRSVNSDGVESANSNVAQKLITGGSPPSASASATVTVNKVPSPPTNTTVVETTAYNWRFDPERWAALRGAPAGSIRKGAACDESRMTDDGYTVISRPSQVRPRPAPGVVLVARCG